MPLRILISHLSTINRIAMLEKINAQIEIHNSDIIEEIKKEVLMSEVNNGLAEALAHEILQKAVFTEEQTENGFTVTANIRVADKRFMDNIKYALGLLYPTSMVNSTVKKAYDIIAESIRIK